MCCSKNCRAYDWSSNTIHLHVRIMIYKIQKKDLIAFQIEGRYSHHPATLSFVSVFSNDEEISHLILLYDRKARNKQVWDKFFARVVQLSTTGYKFGDFVSLLNIRVWWDYTYGSEHQLESYTVY